MVAVGRLGVVAVMVMRPWVAVVRRMAVVLPS